MIIYLDGYLVALPLEGFEVTIDEDYYDDSASTSPALLIRAPFLAGGLTCLPVGHIPRFEKIPFVVAGFIALKEPCLLIDDQFESIYLSIAQKLGRS